MEVKYYSVSIKKDIFDRFQVVKAINPEEAITKAIIHNHKHMQESSEPIFDLWFNKLYFDDYDEDTYGTYCELCNSKQKNTAYRHFYDHHKVQDYLDLVKDQLEATEYEFIE